MSNGIDRAYNSPFFARYEPVRAAQAVSAPVEEVEEIADAGPVSEGAAPSSSPDRMEVASNQFFGDDGFSFRDVLDAVNPLNHIPIVSGMLENATGHKVSTGSKLIGGLLTGPVGFVASLANVIFEQGTGKGVAETMVASLTGRGAEEVQVASAEQVPNAAQQAETVAPVDEVEVSSVPEASKSIQVAMNDVARDRTLLDLYGGSVPSAHRSYQKAQMRSYFTDVKRSQVL